MFNIHTLEWDDELLAHPGRAPRAMLPEVPPVQRGLRRDASPALLGAAVPIAGAAGDQQAATFGQACFEPGSAKNTYGTGCFLLLNTGEKPVASQNGLLTTVGWQIGGEVTYCLEGSVFIAGAVVQWLRDGLGPSPPRREVEALAAERARTRAACTWCPAFVGLGAPYWDPYARGVIVGLTRGTTAGHVARAAVESMAYQTRDVLDAMQRDAGLRSAPAQGRRRRGGQRRAAAVPGRPAGRDRAPAGGGGDDRPGRRVPGRPGRGYWQDTADVAPELGPGPRVHARHARGTARDPLRGLAEGGGARGWTWKVDPRRREG